MPKKKKAPAAPDELTKVEGVMDAVKDTFEKAGELLEAMNNETKTTINKIK